MPTSIGSPLYKPSSVPSILANFSASSKLCTLYVSFILEIEVTLAVLDVDTARPEATKSRYNPSPSTYEEEKGEFGNRW